MPRTATLQGDLFQAPIFDCRPALLPRSGMPLTLLIGCSGQKRRIKSAAAELYTSSRFRTAVEIAGNLGANYFVISAKHGLLKPDKMIGPYDIPLGSLKTEVRHAWGGDIARQINAIKGQICILAAKEYAEPIFTNYAGDGRLTAPLGEIDERYQSHWYEQALALSRRAMALKSLYEEIDRQRLVGETFDLSELSSRTLPSRGVYIFIDRKEHNFLGRRGRIVRIGTHAISEGSKSSLKSRLRNHAGLRDGTGNHRGSIFRLHVGRAMLDKENLADGLPTWGEGQDAPFEVRAREVLMEQRVSEYLKRLEVFIINIEDTPSKNSMRAIVERQLIALCSEGLIPIDRPSKSWLGLSSPMRLIAASGLWNLREVGREYQPAGLGSVQKFLSSGSI